MISDLRFYPTNYDGREIAFCVVTSLQKSAFIRFISVISGRILVVAPQHANLLDHIPAIP